MPLKVPFGLRGAAAVTLFVAASPAFAAMLPLATYRAVHDLVVEGTASGGEAMTVSGRMVTEFTGSPCEGFTTITRFVTDGLDADGQDQMNDQRSKTAESPDGDFEFTNESYSNDKLTDRSEGTARRRGAEVTVKLSEPARKTLALDAGVAFPTEQMTRVIDAAREGKRFLTFDVYDGSAGGETVLATATVIGSPSTAVDDVGDETPIAEAGLAGVRHWPVTVSYFDKDGGEADQSPFFTLSSILYENGILRRLKMDFGKFALVGKLSRLELLPAAPCPE